jgi:hypothetical protein
MGQARDFEQEKLVVAVLLAASMDREAVLAALQGAFGPPDRVCGELAFDCTDYYAAEMGEGIRRLFYSARELVAPERLAALKISTNALEADFAEEGRRRVNLDPGLLSLGRLILASTKPAAHRIPLSGGIYAELTLVYEKGGFRALPWTYPDYRSSAYLAVLEELRNLYRRQRRPRGG